MKKAALFVTSTCLFLGNAWAGCGMGGGAACPMPHGGGYGYGAKPALFLLTLALGYWLLRIAEAEKTKLLKVVGRVVSWIILLGSLAGLLCPLCGHCKRKKMHGYGMASGAMSCPYSAPTDTPATAPEEQPTRK